MNLICSNCNKRPAMVFVSLTDPNTGEVENKGLCLRCAKELKIPGVENMIKGIGISEEELENIEENMSGILGDMDGDFDLGGAAQLPGGLSKMLSDLGLGGGNEDDDDDVDNESIRNLERLFGSSDKGEEKVAKDNKSKGSSRKEKNNKEEKKKKYKYLDAYCENLSAKAREGKMDKIIGRDREIYRVVQILNRRSKNNPCLIGEPGVGKTAIAEGIAQLLVSDKAPKRLGEKELYLLDLTALVAGTQFRGQFESRVKGLVQDVKEAGNVILFVDEVHNLVGTGDAEGSMNAANILKPALSRGEVQMIGATTFNEYRKYIEKDSALERRFQPVTVNEPSIDEAIEVLMGIKEYYELFHRVHVSAETVRQSVRLSERYITDRYLPDKAIDLLDEACSAASLENKRLEEYDQCNRRLKELMALEEEPPLAEDGQVDYEAVAKGKMELAQLKEHILSIEKDALSYEVTTEDLARVIELWTSIPAAKIEETEMAKVADLENTMKKKVIGQDSAVHLVAAAIRRSRFSLSPVRRPASFIFVGPTGVGKTELVKVLSKELFDSPEPLVRLDMSEYMEKHSVSKIVGTPPGYVGYDEAGQLTEKIRRRPYSVVLFDEIEKAHPDVMNVLLQILDEGKITDSHGRTVSFENTVIVMTSNAGSQIRETALGFGKTAFTMAEEKAKKALSEFLRPEFLARIDEIVVFNPLTVEDFKGISALLLDEFKEALEGHGMKFGYDDLALSHIAHKAFGHKAGARDIRRIIRREVEDMLTLKLVSGEKIQLIHLTAKDDTLELVTD